MPKNITLFEIFVLRKTYTKYLIDDKLINYSECPGSLVDSVLDF